MDPIHVPRAPKEAYNKNRPISDLIKAQLAHFQHLEAKLAPELRPNIPHHELTTESAAANYIAAMTAALCQTGPVLVKPRRRPPATAPAPQPIALAAEAEAAEAEPDPQPTVDKLRSPKARASRARHPGGKKP